MSNIKVTVEWEAPVVFAGEEVRCIITFKNAAPQVARSRSLSPNVNGQSDSGRDRWKQDLSRQQPLPKRAQSLRKPEDRTRSHPRGHRPTASLGGSLLSRETSQGPPISGSGRTRGHGRSLSIVSMSSNSPSPNNEAKPFAANGPPAKMSHGRAASLQVGTSRNGGSPLSHPPNAPSQRRATDIAIRRGYSSNAVTGLGITTGQVTGRPRTDSRTSPNSSAVVQDSAQRPIPSRSSTSNTVKASPTLPFSPQRGQEDNTPNFVSKNKILSPVSQTATPRSSLELYSQSNHSTETLASEYVMPQKTAPPPKPPSRRGTYLAPVPSQANRPETLMMGYVQLSGSFTLDGSLVSMSPFESVKMKGVIGGQGGGGVVGVEKSKRESGLLGSLGWTGFGQSLGGLIGGQEMSSIKDMKSIANTKAVPIMSTPQSILFVNLSLQSGESSSYSYSHRLPDNLPPSYKGRAIKIEYGLTIGTQRSQQTTQTQSIRHADFAFKVFSGVTPRGELRIYDLRNPHIVLRDLAQSQAIESDIPSKEKFKNMVAKPKSDTNTNFAAYVEKLLHDRDDDGAALTSPTEARHSIDFEGSGRASVKDYIDLAILRGNASTGKAGSTNRFDIHRSGQRVATVVLARSAYRLGERIIAGLDFRDAVLPCYAVHAFLETLEEVDESIALRSTASITRATRRIQASCFENAVCAQRLSLAFMIPTTAAPEFRTSSIQLKWSLRIEFTTGNASNGRHDEDGLLEEVNEDERGRIMSAAQDLPCDSFDVLVPIRVYGGLGETRDPLIVSSTV